MSVRPQTTLFTPASRLSDDRDRNRTRPLRADHNLSESSYSPQNATHAGTNQAFIKPSDVTKGRLSPRVSANRSPASFSDDASGFNASAYTHKRRSLEIGFGIDTTSSQIAPYSTSSRSSPASSTGRITPSSSSIRISPHLHSTTGNQTSSSSVSHQLSSSWERQLGECSVGMQRQSDYTYDPSRSPVSNHSGRSSRSMPSPSSYGHRHSRSAGSEITSFADFREELGYETRHQLQCIAGIEEIVLCLKSRQSTPSSPAQTRIHGRVSESERPGVPLPPDFGHESSSHSRSDSFGQDYMGPIIRKLNDVELSASTHDRYKTPLFEFVAVRPNHDGCVKIPPTRRAPNPDRGTCHSPRYSNSGSIEISSPRSAFDTPRSHSDNSSCSSIYTS